MMALHVVDLGHLQSLYNLNRITEELHFHQTHIWLTTLLLIGQLSPVVLVSCPEPPQCQALPSQAAPRCPACQQ